MVTVRREDLTFLEGAPLRFSLQRAFSAPPERVFDALADSPGWAKWLPGVRSCTSDRGGVGGTRRLRLAGGAVFDEEFIAWDRPHRWGFTVVASRPAAFRAAVELAELAPAAGGGTALVYRIGFETMPALRPFAPMIRAGATVFLGRAFANLGRLIES